MRNRMEDFMKINFTKKQFRTLIDLIYAGELVVNGHRMPDEIDEEFLNLQQYIYSFAKQMGYEDLIEYSKKYNAYHETRKYDESRIHDFIEESEDEIFWSNLELNLAKRDIAEEYADKVDELEHTELLTLVWRREEEYSQEFYENGLDNVKVDLNDYK